jgi:cytochrome c5
MFRKTVVLLCIAAFVFGLYGLALAERTGQEVYESKCKMCHETGLAGAPKYGTSDWKERAKEGIDELTKDAIKGEKAMPPKGACADCSESEIRAAIQYMIDSAK